MFLSNAPPSLCLRSPRPKGGPDARFPPHGVGSFPKGVSRAGSPFRPVHRSCLSVGGELEGARGQLGAQSAERGYFTLTKFKQNERQSNSNHRCYIRIRSRRRKCLCCPGGQSVILWKAKKEGMEIENRAGIKV